MSIDADFGDAKDVISSRCRWTASFPGSIVVGPGQSLVGYAELVDFAPAGKEIQLSWDASGQRM